jgi:uncharacterized protein (DUF58 family)
MGRLAVTSRGVLAVVVMVVLGLVGAICGAEELVLLAIALAVLVVGGVVQVAARAERSFGIWRIAIRVSNPEVPVGAVVEVEVTVDRDGGRSSGPVWIAELSVETSSRRSSSDGFPGRRFARRAGEAIYLPIVEEGGPATVRRSITMANRGVFAIGGPSLWCFDSFRLVARPLGVGPKATMIVYPEPIAIEVAPALLSGEPGTEEPASDPRYLYGPKDASGDSVRS